VVTAEEIGKVKVFANLDHDVLERLSRAAADISLEPGEYAANQGDDRALIGVLEGRIEVVNSVDGVESIVGERAPGDVMGEVPIVLGSPFPVGFRAAERSRVLRLEARDYHALAAIEPGVAEEVGRLSSDRISGARGLQGLAAKPPPPRAIVLGHWWDPACAELRRFLERNQISFEWIVP
jgi:thioredoxin reductase (NADPH)